MTDLKIIGFRTRAEKEGVGGDVEVAVGVTVDKDGDGHGHAARGDAQGLAAAALEFFETDPEEETEQPPHQGG